ncbi:phytanoyl-CoA dioxygenase family protein [Sphingobacterium detergens]|uniref:Phytanoyl-CoA dioxygenase PhyH n=1 Tax=Sphingobacterium detergens TaxID=1145106 RepID=A0A420B7Q4_SPHD1|nr:phytanoyl-CoA dioxygenase family protein [Sphingobacterium detergens]RKE52645.1 phytanoyl-CoA dioxygenase PhyH [Sphingobacterium detergens]
MLTSEQITIKKNEIKEDGFTVIENVFNRNEVEQLVTMIENEDHSRDTFRRSSDLFAIRQIIKEIPAIYTIIFNDNLKDVISKLLGADHFIVKSIYFDKPATSNWYVSYHQDLTISVLEKIDSEGFSNWTVKHNQYAVQPPLEILENIVTIRIHLDDTDAENGALNIIPGSHNKGIYRPETIDWTMEQDKNCPVPEGGIMIMKPLLLHSSKRTSNNKRRRVIHIEFSNIELANNLCWAERF